MYFFVDTSQRHDFMPTRKKCRHLFKTTFYQKKSTRKGGGGGLGLRPCERVTFLVKSGITKGKSFDLGENFVEYPLSSITETNLSFKKF